MYGHTRRSPVFPTSYVLSVNTSDEIQAWSSTKEQNFLQIFGGFLQDRYGLVHAVESGYISGWLFYASIAAVEILENNESPFSRDYPNSGQWI